MTIAPELVERAAHDANAAAHAARVTLHEFAELPDLHAVVRLFDDIWHPDSDPISAELMRALTKAGNYVAGACDGDELVGAGVGFFAPPAQATLHSHIAGVAAGMSGRAVGYALKLHQRAWCLARDVTAIEWTFDPLVSRNAYFNLAKLGARPIEYLTNFYGGMNDAINADDETDRLLLRWQLTAPHVTEACSGRRNATVVTAERERGAVVALDTIDGAPTPGRLDAPLSLVAAPRDIETLRRTNPGLARQWRQSMRATLGALMRAGGAVTGFDRDGWYVVERTQHPQEAAR